jgi:hypothetical protein
MADFTPAHPGDVLHEDFLKPLKLSQYALEGDRRTADPRERGRHP